MKRFNYRQYFKAVHFIYILGECAVINLLWRRTLHRSEVCSTVNASKNHIQYKRVKQESMTVSKSPF